MGRRFGKVFLFFVFKATAKRFKLLNRNGFFAKIIIVTYANPDQRHPRVLGDERKDRGVVSG